MGSDSAAGGPPGARRVLTGPRGPVGPPEGPVGPHINRAPIRDSRAIRRALSGPVVPKQVSDGNPSFRMCLMGIAVWQVTIKPKNESFGGHVSFSPQKNV